MARGTVLALVICIAALGCGRSKTTQPEATEAEQRKAMEDYARNKAPVLDRTIIENDLKNIHLFLRMAHDASTNGRWPDAETAKQAIKTDPNARKLAQQIDDGTYVIVGSPPDGGIIAYCSKEATVGIIAVDTNGEMKFIKPNELQSTIAQQKR